MGASGGFFARVYQVVRAVPPGRVVTYGQVAALLGSPRAARTVGWALHALPEGTDVPWHRVVNSRGRISTGCREHAAAVQAELLRAEAVEVDREGGVSLRRHLWRAPRQAVPHRLHISRPPG